MWSALSFMPNLPSSPLIFFPPPWAFLSCAPGSFTPLPPPFSGPTVTGSGGGVSRTARLRPKRAAYSSGFVSSRGFASWSGVMSVRTRPSKPRCRMALQKIASTVRSSGPFSELIAIGCAVYWKKNRELAVLDEAVVAGHHGHGRAGTRDRDRVLAATAQREEAADAALRIELPATGAALERRRRHLDAVGDRELAGLAVAELEGLAARERPQGNDRRPPDGGNAERIRGQRLGLGHRPLGYQRRREFRRSGTERSLGWTCERRPPTRTLVGSTADSCRRSGTSPVCRRTRSGACTSCTLHPRHTWRRARGRATARDTRSRAAASPRARPSEGRARLLLACRDCCCRPRRA